MIEKASRFLATEEKGEVSALLVDPPDASTLLVLGHAASSDIHHRSMVKIASSLAQEGVATLRYNFPYMEQGGRRVDSRSVCYATVRAAVDHARGLIPKMKLFAGGRSFGGRMTSMAAADGPLDVAGLVFYAFPLHQARKPTTDRANHLSEVELPMLFLQGTRDALAEIALLSPIVDGLDLTTMKIIDRVDHSFKVLKLSGMTEEKAYAEAAEGVRDWVEKF